MDHTSMLMTVCVAPPQSTGSRAHSKTLEGLNTLAAMHSTSVKVSSIQAFRPDP